MELLNLVLFIVLCDTLTVSSTPLPNRVISHGQFYSALTVCKLLVFGLQLGTSDVIYVTPGNESHCPGDSTECHTLEWYAHSNGSLITDGIEMRFLQGAHSLNTSIAIEHSRNITISGVGNVAPCSNDGTPHPMSWIVCNTITSSGFIISNSTDIHISNLGFDSCGNNITVCENKVSAALAFQQGSDISLDQIVIKNTRGVGLLINNVFGSIAIIDSVFMRAMRPLSPKQYPGNARFWFGPNKCGEQCSETALTTTIVDSSWFLDGQLDAIGLEVIVRCPDVYVLLSNVTIRNNRGRNGGNLALSVTDFSHLTNKSIISIRNSHIYGGRSEKGGGGMRAWIRAIQSSDSHCETDNIHSIIDVYNTTFISNIAYSSGGAIHVSHYQKGGYSCTVRNIKFKLCQFQNNAGRETVVEITRHLILAEHSSPSLNVSFEHCDFHNNSALNSLSFSYAEGSVLSIILSRIVMLNCSFSDNRGTAISLQNSKMNVYDNIRFENNKAAYGAALKICDGSLIFLQVHSCMQFINNFALMGGAIFVQQALLAVAQPCPFQPVIAANTSKEEFYTSFKLEFINNSAKLAGDAVYGGSMDTCYTINKYSFKIFDKVFNLSSQNGPSWVSSDPQGICFCLANKTTHVPHHFCQTKHPAVEVYPGESFSISAVTVGQFNGSSPGVIQPFLTNESDTHKLKLVGTSNRNPGDDCTSFTFTLLTNRSVATIILRPFDNSYNRNFDSNVSITVNILPCPLGFKLSRNYNGEYTCDCHEIIKAADTLASCDISTGTIQVQDTWLKCLHLSKINNRSTCDNMAVSKECGRYCSEHGNISMTQLDDQEQCRYNRTGIRCGECQHGLSHFVSQFPYCKPCSNRGLLKYVPLFLLSGAVAIFILTLLNVTVTEGTLYGLVFYANVLFANHSFFPNNTRLGRTAWLFVSIINLEPTRASCAYDGMTGYQYIWLRFGYVFYLLFTQVIIILSSRRFMLLTRFFGKNVLKVLATLLFLSHAQLLYACFHTFWFAKVYYMSEPNRAIQRKVVWDFDGNIPYLGLKHALLFAVASFCSVFALLFMFSLLFIQCLQKRSDRWYLRWVERLRPYYEVYTGSCHDQYRFWPGFLYLMRTALYALNVYVNSYDARFRRLKMVSTAAICILIISFACIFPQGVYKKWPLNILEFFFLLNLCIMSILLGFHDSPSEILCYSVLPVMIVSCGILLYHIYQQIKNTRAWKVLVKRFSVCAQTFRKKRYYSSLKKDDSEQDLLLPQPLPEFIQVIESPEPVLVD